MKAIFQKDDLAKALDAVSHAAQNKVNSNTNNGIYISLQDASAEFQANDFSIAIKTSCPAAVEENGNIVVAAPQLPSMIRLLPPGEVEMEQKKGEGYLTFSAGNAVYRFPVRSPEDFPSVERMKNASSCTVAAGVFNEMVQDTQYAAAIDKQKPLFNGILFEIQDTSFVMAATNTHRLAVKETALAIPANNPGRFIVPSGIMSEVLRLFSSNTEETVDIFWAKTHVAFASGTTYFISTLINGEYPDYRRVIPQHFDSMVTVELKPFREAVALVSPISRDMDYKTINFHFEEDHVEIFEEDKSIGSSRTSVPVILEGIPLHIVFNCFYIEDILKHSKGEKIIFHLQKVGPMLVEQEEDKKYQYVVTPMRGR